jgi:hypothetical protein
MLRGRHFQPVTLSELHCVNLGRVKGCQLRGMQTIPASHPAQKLLFMDFPRANRQRLSLGDRRFFSTIQFNIFLVNNSARRYDLWLYQHVLQIGRGYQFIWPYNERTAPGRIFSYFSHGCIKAWHISDSCLV